MKSGLAVGWCRVGVRRFASFSGAADIAIAPSI